MTASGTLIWETSPTNSSEFDWTPDGALTNTFNNISGSGVNATISFSGDTGTLSGWNFGGGDTPEVATDNGTEALQFFTTGFNATGITITIAFSQPVNEVGFDLAHVNGQGPNGDSYTITASEVGGGTLFPTFNESANPSYTTNNSGFVNSNNNSTAGDNDEVGVNFSSTNGINSITLVWDECTACTAGTVHGSAIQDISFCLSDSPAEDCPTITSEGIFDPNSDVLITSYHQSMAKTTTGIVVWGEDMDSDGTDATTITEITPANGYNYLGTPIHFTVSGNSGGQAFLATTASLYAWGLSGEVVDGSFATSGAFNDMNATQTLPFFASNITQLHASSDVLFVLSAGQVWVATTDETSPPATGNANADGDVWQQVQTSAGVPLTDVVNVTGNKYAGYALLNSGDIYAWGDNVELGNGGGTQNLDFATLMTAPPVAITQISSFTHNDNDTGLLVLGVDAKVYGVGANTIGEIITTGTGNVNTWTAIQASGGGDLTDVIQISTSHTSEEWAGASIITTGATASDPNILYTWGLNNNNSLGHGADGTIQNPTIPPSFTVGTDDPVSASVGGHATTFFNRANGGSICFVGHIVQGSTGSLTTGDGSSFECVIPATVDLCGSEIDDTPTAVDDTASVDEDDTVNIVVLDDDDFGGDGPSTGTISITSGPTNGTATVNNGGTPNDPTDDTIDYTPNADYNGPDQITYEICDADGDCTTAVIDITVDPVDDTPTAVDDTASVDEDDTVNIVVLDDDDFGGDGPSTGTISITSGPTNG
ncbi:Ig-like domain-containing protein, partial [Algibacter marinivivus]|uniref:Ig-like domain-containing protein n=1 Tax=Algibacter marinivivus TaxID=2100723 RepID=UPI001FE411A0